MLLACGSITTRAATVVVTTTHDSGPGSLRAGLAAAVNGDTLDITVSGAISLTTGELLVTNDLTILGPGPALLAISGNFPAASNAVFHVTNGATVWISGLAMTNGHYWEGGGVINEGATLTLSNCVLSGNGASVLGGAILNLAGRSQTAGLTLLNCTLSNNIAGTVGGAIYNWGEASNATLTIVGSTIVGNSAGDSGGGAIKNDGSPGGNASAFITNCNLSANSTTGSGGAIYNDGLQGSATLVIAGSTLSSNQAGPPSTSYGGGAIFSDGGSGNASVLLINTTLSGNSAGFGGGAIRNGGTSFGITSLTLLSCTWPATMA
jgi:hypothetical protein